MRLYVNSVATQNKRFQMITNINLPHYFCNRIVPIEDALGDAPIQQKTRDLPHHFCTRIVSIEDALEDAPIQQKTEICPIISVPESFQ